jgi:hypothetical protein
LTLGLVESKEDLWFKPWESDMSAGIDYGMGTSNRDAKTGIRYGVISQHSINPDALGDIVKTLRELVAKSDSRLWGTGAIVAMQQAADEIERLRLSEDEIESVRLWLKKFRETHY